MRSATSRPARSCTASKSQGYKQGPIKRHGCPSHGVGLTPDEREVWVVDAANQSIHVFDATVMPPKQLESIKLKDEPGWVTFSLDGKYAYPSTGDVIDTKTRKIITELKDETGAAVQSEKMIEIRLRRRQAGSQRRPVRRRASFVGEKPPRRASEPPSRTMTQ